jgi:uncharacterized protein YegJ (DUF2314 family)
MASAATTISSHARLAMFMETPFRQVLIGIFVFALCVAVRAIYRRFHADPVVKFDKDDPRLLAAGERARRTLDRFWPALASSGAGQEAFTIKVRLAAGGDFEHVWLAVDGNARATKRGTLLNRPHFLAARAGDSIAFSEDQIIDWCYRDNGKLVGGETMRLMLETLSPAKARKMARELGLNA